MLVIADAAWPTDVLVCAISPCICAGLIEPMFCWPTVVLTKSLTPIGLGIGIPLRSGRLIVLPSCRACASDAGPI